eukprot:m.140935 g.140935  ORF g.140935 m.140935 type:complete len:55 (+) comp14837_c0_seq6:383-547(+)
MKAVNVMAETILCSKVPVHIVATGALTNVAMMLLIYPEVASSSSDVCIHISIDR